MYSLLTWRVHSPHIRVFGEVELTQHVWCSPPHAEQRLLRRTNTAENGAITTSQAKVTNLHHTIRGHQNVALSQENNKHGLPSQAESVFNFILHPISEGQRRINLP